MKQTFEQFANRAGVSVDDVKNAVRENYLVLDKTGDEPLIEVNIFAHLYCKAVREGADLSNLPKWKGTRGKLQKRLHGIAIYQNSAGKVTALRPDGVTIPFRTMRHAENYCITTTEFLKSNSRVWAKERRTKSVYLSRREIEYLLSAIPVSRKHKLLREKLMKAVDTPE